MSTHPVVGLRAVVRTPDRAARDSLLQWNETELSEGGSSYTAHWLCWPDSWTGSLSREGGAVESGQVITVKQV